ncbi:MAG TPA: CHAT domain-containing protein [Rhizobacter sp.]|nr:CHAT domain-containing protein [Rhizobacter sp.]
MLYQRVQVSGGASVNCSRRRRSAGRSLPWGAAAGRGVCALLCALGLSAQAQSGAEGLSEGNNIARNALARQRDAASLLATSAEGRALYERDVVKLDGYAYCGRSIALAEQGEFRQSIRAASKALHLGASERNDDLKALAQRDLAIAYSYAGLLDEAEAFAKGALALPAQQPQQAHAPAYKVLGDVAVRRGRYDAAISAFQRSIELASERFRPLVTVSLANAYTAAGRAPEALATLAKLPRSEADKLGAFYTRSRANALLADGQIDPAAALFGRLLAESSDPAALYNRLWASEGLGRVELARGNQPAALRAYLDTVHLADTLRSKFQSEEFKTGLFGDIQKVFDTALELSINTQNFEAAWTLSEASRSRQLLDSVRERTDDTLAHERVTLAQLQQTLAPGEAVLQFHVLDKRSLVWLITRSGMSAGIIGAGQAALAQQVEAFRASVIERRRDTTALAQNLHRTLFANVDLTGVRRLFIVPHGPLHYLPFQALHDGRSFLIERAAVTVWPSSAIGANLLAKGNPPAASLLGFGNPSTDLNVPLPGAEREVAQVAKTFARSDVYVQHEATRQRFRSSANSASVVHVAAHAELDEADPLFSRILFAATPTEPGLLEARDIYALNLSGVRLVTLSACESGLGKVARGDEIVGFTRSFLSAGVNSVVASLWPVADESTDLLMGRLYRELSAGHDLMESMRSAQLEVQKNRRFAHPFFWAPFNVIGNGRLLTAGTEPAR